MCKHCCSGKAVSITYCECVCVALGIQNSMRMRHVDTCCLLRLYNISPHYLKRHDFGKKLLNINMCALIFSKNLSESFLILRSIQRDMNVNVHRAPCKVPVILVRF